jgi:hypothetical protein
MIILNMQIFYNFQLLPLSYVQIFPSVGQPCWHTLSVYEYILSDISSFMPKLY